MKRKDFLKMCSILGIGLPLHMSLKSCGSNSELPGSGIEEGMKVTIVGAGPAGLTAAYLLTQKGIDVQILEASNRYGGRTKRTTDFVDFPIPLGAEWLHVERGIFDEIVNDPNIDYQVETTPYNPNVDYALYEGQEITLADVGFTIDQKFINSTWFDFFDTYVVPSVKDKILFNQVVESIDYSSEEISVKTADETFLSDRVIVCVPVKILQNGAINFSPPLPENKQEAIEKVKVWDGCKAFIEFSEKFYPAAIAYDITPASAGQKLYYDAGYGQNSDRHVLGLFAVGTGTLPYVQLSDNELKEYMLNELDEIFDGKASQNYVQHIFQNWNQEPFANGAYVTDQEDWRRLRTLGKSVDGKLFFAGDAYTDGSDWSSVHAAARSAKSAVEEMT